jgi:hypothetical protein
MGRKRSQETKIGHGPSSCRISARPPDVSASTRACTSRRSEQQGLVQRTRTIDRSMIIHASTKSWRSGSRSSLCRYACPTHLVVDFTTHDITRGESLLCAHVQEAKLVHERSSSRQRGTMSGSSHLCAHGRAFRNRCCWAMAGHKACDSVAQNIPRNILSLRSVISSSALKRDRNIRCDAQ